MGRLKHRKMKATQLLLNIQASATVETLRAPQPCSLPDSSVSSAVVFDKFSTCPHAGQGIKKQTNKCDRVMMASPCDDGFTSLRCPLITVYKA